MLQYLAAAALVAPHHTCSLMHVDACTAMFELVDRKDFKRELRRFLGPGKASWTMEDWDKTDQVLTTLSVSAEEPANVGDGLLRMGGCFPHNCLERAEVFFSIGGKIKAVALLYHDCLTATCTGDEDFTLRILMREKSPILMAHAKTWAGEDMRDWHRRFPQFEPQKLSHIAIDVITK